MRRIHRARAADEYVLALLLDDKDVDQPSLRGLHRRALAVGGRGRERVGPRGGGFTMLWLQSAWDMAIAVLVWTTMLWWPWWCVMLAASYWPWEGRALGHVGAASR